MVFPGVQLAPETGGVRVHDVRPKRFELPIQKGVHGERDPDRLHGHFRDRNAFQPGDFLRRDRRHTGVARDELGSGLPYPFREVGQAACPPERVKPDDMAAPDQFGGDREHRVGMSVRRDAEERDAFFHRGGLLLLKFSLFFHDLVSRFRCEDLCFGDNVILLWRTVMNKDIPFPSKIKRRTEHLILF